MNENEYLTLAHLLTAANQLLRAVKELEASVSAQGGSIPEAYTEHLNKAESNMTAAVDAFVRGASSQ